MLGSNLNLYDSDENGPCFKELILLHLNSIYFKSKISNHACSPASGCRGSDDWVPTQACTHHFSIMSSPKYENCLQRWLCPLFSPPSFSVLLKLCCRYEYTRPYMINRIWSLKQLWLQVNGHAWFHLHGHRWPVRNGEGAKNSKWKYIFHAGFELTPRQSMTGKSAP